ncbi:sorting nexin-16-like [Mercenaria mercenaria]|uniref:sorting nexin-16-like n=1 Tax=Mercenaria mercenaria TaxID=6596 RepID=UPI00234F8E97|nr:sorting nexin-16-like [Mercenaria mercenaria]XP_045192374.2 sorting nexin-16-like [Mercenaria mercenaria]XP_045192375.2 sorting nexin-16-like [Mercenaria mercenaria]
MEEQITSECENLFDPLQSATNGDIRRVHIANNDEATAKLPSSTGPHKNEAKLSLSEYHTARSLSSSGEESPLTSSQEKTTPNNAGKETKIRETETFPTTSTPIRQNTDLDTDSRAVGVSPVTRRGTGSTNTTCSTDSGDRAERRKKRVSFVDPLEVRVPLVGYEVMEQRAKFTVFKLHVHKGNNDNWFVFRRYTDFVQLQQKVKKLFPMFRLPLPPKRWFRNNFEKEFVEDRMLGLQAFVDSILCHSGLCNCIPVQEFFCFRDPPGPHDSVEESRAYCDELEDAVYSLKKEIHAKDVEMELLREELSLFKSQVEMLSRALREANANGATVGVTEPSPAQSLAECDFMAPEADQSTPMSLKDEISQSEAISQKQNGRSELDSETEVNTKGKGNIFKKKENVAKRSGNFRLHLN